MQLLLCILVYDFRGSLRQREILSPSRGAGKPLRRFLWDPSKNISAWGIFTLCSAATTRRVPFEVFLSNSATFGSTGASLLGNGISVLLISCCDFDSVGISLVFPPSQLAKNTQKSGINIFNCISGIVPLTANSGGTPATVKGCPRLG